MKLEGLDEFIFKTEQGQGTTMTVFRLGYARPLPYLIQGLYAATVLQATTMYGMHEIWTKVRSDREKV